MQPEGWEEHKLGDVCDIKIGGTPSRSVDRYWAKDGREGYPWVSISDLRSSPVTKTKEQITQEGVDNSNVKLIEAGTNLMSFKLTLGRVARAGTDLYTNEAIAGFIPKTDNIIEQDYLFYALPGAVDNAEHDQAVKGKTLNKGKLTNLQLRLPPIDEQRKIADVLQSVDEAITATQDVIDQTRKVKQDLLHRLLTRGIGHTSFKQTDIGEIPENWEVVELRDLVDFKNGKAHEKEIDHTGKYIVVNSKFISTAGHVRKRSDADHLPALKGDVLIVMSDVPNGKAIASCFLVNENDTYTVNQRIGLLRSKDMQPEFLCNVLHRNRYFLAFDDGVKQTNLRKDEVLDCPVVVPSIDEQKEISTVLEVVSDQINEQLFNLEQLQTLKAGVISDLLSGRVRVPLDERMKEEAA